MTQAVFEVAGDNFADFDGFIAEFNHGFVSHVDRTWGGNLDALNAYLSWHESGRCTIRWINAQQSRIDLGSMFDILLGIMRDSSEFVDMVPD
jgi:hypothetical protein